MTKQFLADIGLLKPNPWNSNFVSPENEAKLLESIRQFGLFKPIVVCEVEDDAAHPYVILGGEHRWKAAKEVGLAQVPVFSLGVIDEATAKRITLIDNARYGQDDAIELAKLLEEIGDTDELQQILPYTAEDLSAIFSSVNIALDELDLPESFEADQDATPEPKPEKVAKTHTIMRFKVAIGDAEKLTELLTKIQKRQGFTAADELTNAGDALIYAMFDQAYLASRAD